MRKYGKLLCFIIIILILPNGCGKRVSNNDSNNIPNEELTFEAEVIEEGETLLIAPDKDSNEYKSSDKISVNHKNSKLKDLEGKDITLQDLKVGDIVIITYNGTIAESYPAQITALEIDVIDHNNLIDGYLAMIDDIYQEDSGLNGSIDKIAVDTTGWIELSDIEKGIIFSELKQIYDVDILEGTYEELFDQGLIDKENLYFPSGIHIIISNMSYDANKDKVTYSIEKWRSEVGAVGADAIAEYDGDKWRITKKNIWIS